MNTCVPQIYKRDELGYTSGMGSTIKQPKNKPNVVHFYADVVDNVALKENPNRTSYLVRNQSGNNIYIAFGHVATNQDLVLQPNEYFGLDQNCPSDELHILGTVANQGVIYVEEIGG